MIDRITIAEALYTAYCMAVGGRAFNGDPLPEWDVFYTDDTKVKQAEAWLAAADRAIILLTPEVLPPHQQRVVKEQASLEEKLVALAQFINTNPIFTTLPVDERTDLKVQHSAMSGYNQALKSRIQRF